MDQSLVRNDLKKKKMILFSMNFLIFFSVLGARKAPPSTTTSLNGR